MSLDSLFAGFLPRVAIGAGTVLGLFLVAWLVIPRRATVNASRRITK
jgi:hypothetical protein